MKKLTKLSGHMDLHFMQETRIVYLHDEVSRFCVDHTLRNLDYLTKLSEKPITLRICSPGGSVDYGLVLYDFIKSSKAPVHTVCSGMAASMAAILLGAGKKGHRTVTKNSRIMIHQPTSGFIGKASDIEVHAKETARIRSLLNQLLSNDTKQPLKKVTKDTELDYWMTADEAKAYGLVDKVI